MYDVYAGGGGYTVVIISWVFRGSAFRKVRNRQWHLACRRFLGPKDEDLTIARRLLGLEVITWLGGLRLGEIEKGKGHGFNDTFRLSTLVVVVIFLPATFPILTCGYAGCLVISAI
ncbi:hypothetical protein TIFTF001_012089 [Ficus carica]|uniref:Uncharacterized protein n=1 Tax=Ficus carica TaxID=3494 RepID=A0AA87ZZS4_FICCA|nr:hypothetical protein TIFTF001_012089 [Ficus carica]